MVPRAGTNGPAWKDQLTDCLRVGHEDGELMGN
jgi:hypothetical protein